MMTLRKRWLAAAFALLAVAGTSSAQAPGYPNKPIKLWVGFASGGGTDVAARLFAQKLTPVLGQPVLGQPVVVENRTGASGSIAASEVAKAEADRHRLLMIASTTFIHAALSSKAPYQVKRDFTPIAMTTFSPLVMVVGPSVPAKTVPELIEFARANPGKLTFGSDGIGGTSHLAGEMFNTMAGLQMAHVPFKGNGDVAVAIAGGQVDIGFPSLATAQPLLQAGKYRALAVTSGKRTELMSQLPTLDELGLKGFDIYAWFAFVGPAGMKESLKKQVLEVAVGTPDQLSAYFRQQHAIIAKLGKEVNIKLD